MTRFPLALLAAAALAASAAAQEKPVTPLAVLPFDERGSGAKEYGAKVADLLFARLAANPALYLVDRADLKKAVEEQALGASGAVQADGAAKVGQLTGAKILVTGSVIQVDKKLVLVAKVIGTETTRVLGASADGKVGDDIGPMVDRLAEAVAGLVAGQADKLLPKKATEVDRAAAINAKLANAARPPVTVSVPERHIGAPAIDPAAQTELTKLLRDTGFELFDADDGGRLKADVLLTGEGFSESAGRVGNLVSVKARVELKATDRKTGKVLAADRQTVVIVDVAEQIAAKAALQEAAAAIAERMLPKLAGK